MARFTIVSEHLKSGNKNATREHVRRLKNGTKAEGEFSEESQQESQTDQLIQEARRHKTAKEFIKHVMNNSNISQTGEFRAIKINKISGSDYRKLDDALRVNKKLSIEEAESIIKPTDEYNIGQKVKYPIEVFDNGDGTYALNAGNHRLAQMLINGDKEILANVANVRSKSTEAQLKKIFEKSRAEGEVVQESDLKDAINAYEEDGKYNFRNEGFSDEVALRVLNGANKFNNQSGVKYNISLIEGFDIGLKDQHVASLEFGEKGGEIVFASEEELLNFISEGEKEGSEGTLTFAAYANEDYIKNIIAHEYGHSIQGAEVVRLKNTGYDIKKEHENIYKNISFYAQENHSELFAEAYTLSQTKEFSSFSKERKEYIQNILGDKFNPIHGTKISKIITGTQYEGMTVREIISSAEGREFLKEEGYFE